MRWPVVRKAGRPAPARRCGLLLLSWLALGATAAFAEGPDVVVAGTFPGKALLMINGGPPQAVAVGRSTPEGVRVLAVEGDAVTFEIAGRRQTLRPGDRVARTAAAGDGDEVVLSADAGGHFRTGGRINGARVEFLVDTGATLVSIGASDARRAGIELRAGRRALAQTANGSTPIWLVKVDSLQLGELTLHNVDAAVHQHDLPATLLGMSALGRFELRHEGRQLRLRKRF